MGRRWSQAGRVGSEEGNRRGCDRLDEQQAQVVVPSGGRGLQAVLAGRCCWLAGRPLGSAGLEATKVLKGGPFQGGGRLGGWGATACRFHGHSRLSPSQTPPSVLPRRIHSLATLPAANVNIHCVLVAGWPDSHSSSSRSRFSVDVDAAERQRSPTPTLPAARWRKLH